MINFQKLRHDPAHHLGLGDVRITIAQQGEIEDRVAELDGEANKLAWRVAELERKNALLVEALEKLRDCDWVITLPDRMDAVRAIAREALAAVRGAHDL